ncbi:trypsin-like serine peptidase [Pedococcus bigeumensis]|nr:serine protease [Pedococcus bigeumensis]
MSALPDPPAGPGPNAVLPESTFTPEPASVEQIEQVRSAKQDAWRTEPLARKVAYARRQGAPVPNNAPPTVVDETLERIFKNADFLPGWWLTTGAKRADAVAKLTTAVEMGTGFLVSPWLLMTNHHVLDSVETAADTIAWFRYVEDEDGASQPTKVALQPEKCFVTSPADDLDFTLVAVAPVDDKPPSETFGYIALHGGVGKIVKGQSVNVIQHPQGRHREVTLRNNTFSGPLVDAQGVENPKYLLYDADTEPGSSGAPLLSDTWELIGLHHASEQKRNAQGQFVDLDGNLADANTPESKRIWIANSGIRISAIVKDLTSRTIDASNGTEAPDMVSHLLGLGGNL